MLYRAYTELPPAVLAIIGILGISFFLQMLKFVPQSEHWTLERFGRYRRTLRPGLNIIFPYLESVGMRISMREQVLDVPPQYIITADNATVNVDAVVFFKVFDAFKAAYEVENLQAATTQLAITNIRTVMGAMELDKLLSNREEINAKLLGVIDEATDPWGVKVIRIEIKDITPPEDIQKAMSVQLTADRQKRAEILQAEADKKASILRAEGKSEAILIEGEANKQARILAAEALKEEIFLKAEGREQESKIEAKAIHIVSKSIKEGSIQAPNYFLGTEYVKSMKKVGTSPNSKVIFMPFEAANVMSGIGSLTHAAKTMMEKEETPKKTKA